MFATTRSCCNIPGLHALCNNPGRHAIYTSAAELVYHHSRVLMTCHMKISRSLARKQEKNIPGFFFHCFMSLSVLSNIYCKKAPRLVVSFYCMTNKSQCRKERTIYCVFLIQLRYFPGDHFL
jgi:hypothetical protein